VIEAGLRTADEPAVSLPVGAPRWYQDAVLYEVHVRAYNDSDGDGIGDFRGLERKLDHIRDLGVTAVWLLPFYPSPLKDDGYDIASYREVHPAYGSLRDFRRLLRAAHARNLRVITELVMNHTSDQHAWFQRARRARPGSVARNFYVWSDTTDRYADARIIFRDFEASNWAWDPVAGQYYWHRFYSHQPDLNFDSPAVRDAMFRVVDFWLEMGVDGLRLDAVPYLFEREGTNCENLPETLELLTDLRRHVDDRFDDRMLLAEANQWPEDAVAYFGKGDRCHMAFHFPLMPRMFMSTRMEDRFPLVDILQQTPPIPPDTQWATFLRNHDELTLEMVTDEERDYMYRVYARDPQARINLGIRRRLAPLLGNDRRLIEAMNGLLFSLPGTPVLYYGDEIGMGDNIYLGDRDAVRTPMQWSADRNAGFSSANPQRLYLPAVADTEFQPAAVNVEAQQNNPASLLWWMRHVVALRRRYHALATGSIRFLYPENRKVLVFVRELGPERVLVVANLSRNAQFVELDLSEFEGTVPIELFGQTEFPRIGHLPYFVTLGPYAFYWFSIEPPAEPDDLAGAPPEIRVQGGWEAALRGSPSPLDRQLPAILRRRRWFGGKSKRIRSAIVVETMAVPDPGTGASAGLFLLVRVTYAEGEPETYGVPVVARPDQDPAPERGVLARVESAEGRWLLLDGLGDSAFDEALLSAIERRRRIRGREGQMVAMRTERFRALRGGEPLAPVVSEADQTNTSLLYGDRFILKVFRRVDEGTNPDLEMGRFLTTAARYANTPPVAGALEYGADGREPMTLAILQGFVRNEGDAWRYTVDTLQSYLEQALAHGADEPPPAPVSLVAAVREPPPPLAEELFSSYLESARVLGARIAELHVALGSRRDDPAFASEPFSALDQRAFAQSMRTLLLGTLRSLRASVREFGGADELLDREGELQDRVRSLLATPIGGRKIRCHGDLHLGQLLYTGRDFVVIDFEGEPARPLGERRIKRPALRDVASMLRSFGYAAEHALRAPTLEGLGEDLRRPLEGWTRFWTQWVSAAFVDSYLGVAASGGFLPATDEGVSRLLEVMLLEKALYEIGYELSHRPDWVPVPVGGVLQLLRDGV
jgi:maltose alpha-D-glucosyltransferase / alpha-amylase